MSDDNSGAKPDSPSQEMYSPSPRSVSLLDLISMSDASFKPRKTVVFGGHGKGKTVYACSSKKCVLLPTEDGYTDIHKWTKKSVPVFTFPDGEGRKKRVLTSVQEVDAAIGWISNSDHDFQNLVFDSAEAFEALCEKRAAADFNKDSIADVGFGKGQEKSAGYFANMLAGLSYLNDVKNMGVIVIAHEEVIDVRNLEGENYGKHTVRLDKRNRPQLLEWADDVLFIHDKVIVRTKEVGFGKTEAKAANTAQIKVFTTGSPTCDAKNRLGLPEVIDRDWSIYERAIEESGKYFLGERISDLTGPAAN